MSVVMGIVEHKTYHPRYRCSKCNKVIVDRNGKRYRYKFWAKSFCDKCGRDARMMMVIHIQQDKEKK